MKTTRELINRYLLRLKAGEDCLQDFIGYSRGYIQYIAYKYLIDKSFAEDVVFAVYDRIFGAIYSFDGKRNGLAWIVKIAQNEAYKFNRDHADACEFSDALDAVGAECASCENAIIDKYDVERAIARLDERERTVIEYGIFYDMTVREIAQKTDMPKSTVAHTFKRALKKLEEYLQGGRQ